METGWRSCGSQHQGSPASGRGWLFSQPSCSRESGQHRSRPTPGFRELMHVASTQGPRQSTQTALI